MSTEEKKEIIESAETKRQEIIKSDKFLSDTKNYKHHPESFYTSRLLNESIEQARSLLNLSSTEIRMNNNDCDNKNSLSDKKNYKHHPESSHSNCPSSGLTQTSLNMSTTENGSGPKPTILMKVMVQLKKKTKKFKFINKNIDIIVESKKSKI